MFCGCWDNSSGETDRVHATKKHKVAKTQKLFFLSNGCGSRVYSMTLVWLFSVVVHENMLFFTGQFNGEVNFFNALGKCVRGDGNDGMRWRDL